MKGFNIQIPVGEVDGYNLLIRDNNEQLQSYWNINKWYEEGMIKFIHNNYKGGTFIDIGGSIGNHAVAFSKVADKVYTFEPLIQYAFHLKANLIVNKIENVFLYNLGLSNRNGITRMFNDDRSDGGGTITEDGEILIPVMKLDEFSLENVKLIKIDVEGHEEEVLEGAKETIKSQLPDLFIETSTYQEYKDTLKKLNEIDERYRNYHILFNNTPTTLFTIKEDDEFDLKEDPRNHVLKNDILEKFYDDMEKDEK